MKFGLIPVNVGVKSIEQIVGYSQLAESVGIESVWTFRARDCSPRLRLEVSLQCRRKNGC